jgi:hypothetical protein
MLWMGMWVHPYAYAVLHAQVGMSFSREENGAMAKSECCCKVIVEAPNPQRLHPSTMAYICKVF